VTLAAGIRLDRGALRLEVEVDAPAGDVVAVLGPNGAGKTTLLLALAGLVPVAEGRIVLDGTVLDDAAANVFVPAERRPVGLLFQDYLLFPHLSVLDNVAFAPRARRLPSPDAIAAEWLELVGMGDFARVRPAALSGGQAQRVALARALAGAPRMMLLDEPLAALDATTRVEVRRLLRTRLSEYEGVAVIVTHDPVDAAALAGRVVVLEAGRVAQAGSIADITAHPRSRYVADLAGLNLWRGRARAGHVQVGDAEVAAAGAADGDVFATLPPHAVSLHRARPEGTPRNVWRARVAGVERLGDRARVSLQGPLPLVAEVTPAALAELGISVGDSVWASFKATEVTTYVA
jgi:molybdate transport system ATP-binding protein